MICFGSDNVITGITQYITSPLKALMDLPMCVTGAQEIVIENEI